LRELDLAFFNRDLHHPLISFEKSAAANLASCRHVALKGEIESAPA
jgi:hypothetical protein